MAKDVASLGWAMVLVYARGEVLKSALRPQRTGGRPGFRAGEL